MHETNAHDAQRPYPPHLPPSKQIGLAALAAQFNLPVPVTERAVKDRLGTPTLLRAKLRGGGFVGLCVV